MSYPSTQPAGAAPVSRIEAMDNQAVFLITALRLTSKRDARETQALWDSLALTAGSEHAQDARNSFEHLMVLFARHGRRPLLTHDGRCSCVGADEAVFAQFVALAALGEPEDAMLMGMLMLNADIVPLAVGVAQQLGLLTRMTWNRDFAAQAPVETRAYH